MEDTKCLVQLDEILKYMPTEYLEKIPYDIRNSIMLYKDKEYIWKYDKNKTLKEQELDRKTIAMLSYLNMEYMLNNEQKEYMEKIHRINEQKLEKEKQEKYNLDVFSKSKVLSTRKEKTSSENVAMIEYKESFFKKIFKKIKNFFKR